MSTNKKTLLLNIFLIITGILLCYKPPVDPDFGWHYKYGESIVKDHKLLRDNIYSYTLSDYKWNNSYWVAEIFIYILFSKTGAIGLNIFLTTIILSFLVFVILKKQNHLTKLFAVIIYALISGSYNLPVRPMAFSTLFLFIEIYILLNRKNLVKFLPFLFVFWANTHPDFVPGILILGIYTLFEIIQSFFKEKSINLKEFLFTILPLILSLLATLINPYGINLWKTMLNEGNNVNFKYIQEITPITITAPLEGLIYHFFIVALFLSTAVFVNKEFRPWYLVSLGLFFILSSRAMYFYRIFYILGFFSLITTIEKFSDIIELRVEGITDKRIIKVFQTILFLIIFFTGLQLFTVSLDQVNWTKKSRIPYKAVQFVKKNKPDGNMFNSYTTGGYLIWQLPEYKTFIDGRMASWKDSLGNYILADYADITLHPEDNEELINNYFSKYNIQWAFLLKNDVQLPTISNYLEGTKGWEKIYEDEVAVIIRGKKPNN